MTTMTAAPSRPSPLLWIGLAVIAAVTVLIAFAGRDDPTIGGVADPEGTGRQGLAALRLLIEEAGGTAELDIRTPTPSIDTALLATRAYEDFLAEIEGRPSQTEENLRPVLDWVEAGGTLVTTVDVPGGPLSGARLFDDEDAEVERGVCTTDLVDGVERVRPLVYLGVGVETGDTSCFGNQSEAIVVVRELGEGLIVRLATTGLFFNRALDDADNAALAARTLGLGDGRTVGFLSGPELGIGSAFDGPVNDDGEPVGAGDDGLLDLVPTRVIAMVAGLAGAFLLYALARGRRLGSPVIEPLPIELPSSTYVEALGRLYMRAESPRRRSADILRRDFRTVAARRIGMSASDPTEDLARALSLTPGVSPDDLAIMLDEQEPRTDDALIALAANLNEQRNRMERGGDYRLVAMASTATTDESSPDRKDSYD